MDLDRCVAVRTLLQTWRKMKRREQPRLTPAEHDIVVRLLEGLTNVEIARARHVKPRTIANQIASIFRKLGVCSRVELAARRDVQSQGTFACRDIADGSLSTRERHVAAFVAQGHSNKLIAFELDLSEAAISNAVRAAAAKLGARTRVELARMLASVPESLDD
jgi:DNA-binding NarL/FixJ family response regulator